MEMETTEALTKARELLDKSEYIRGLGIEILELSDDHAIGRMPFDLKKGNPAGAVHGGCLFSLADTIAGTLAFHNAGKYVVTVEGSLHFLAAATDTEYVYCRAEMKRFGKSLVTVNVDITNDNDKLLDSGCFTYYRI